MINIRLATKDEVADLQHLNNEVFIDNAKYDEDLDLSWATGEKGTQYFTQLLNDSSSLCLIAEDEGKRIGYLAAGPKEIDYRKSKYFEIQNMGVVPGYRSKGIGKLLMEKCFEWARVQGFQKAFVNAYIKNQEAAHFYKKNGFEEIDISLERNI